jgi:hypothetical protein
MLEAYITPLLMGYVEKYIKNIRPSDLNLSLWGGDVVLKNLEMKLDVLEHELNLPLTFLSGRVHELQIHIPWTSLGACKAACPRSLPPRSCEHLFSTRVSCCQPPLLCTFTALVSPAQVRSLS